MWRVTLLSCGFVNGACPQVKHLLTSVPNLAVLESIDSEKLAAAVSRTYLSLGRPGKV